MLSNNRTISWIGAEMNVARVLEEIKVVFFMNEVYNKTFLSHWD